MKRAIRIIFKGQKEHRHDADRLLTEPGAAVLINRGVVRSIVIACPDGCGENLTINLDHRAGPAWRYYERDFYVSLFPSVWRESGCRSHFIVWKSRIYWCDWNDELETPAAEIIAQIEQNLTMRFTRYIEIADQLKIVPWAVLSACEELCRRGVAMSGVDKQRGHFKLKVRDGL